MFQIQYYDDHFDEWMPAVMRTYDTTAEARLERLHLVDQLGSIESSDDLRIVDIG